MSLAIISGVNGQDGAYLSQKLIASGIDVVGLVRSDSSDLSGLEYLGIKDKIKIHKIDLTNRTQIAELFEQYNPDFFFNLAAQSSVAQSFRKPEETILFNLHSTLNILETIRLNNYEVHFYQATSSEMFGNVDHLPITEKTLLNPKSPYAISKAACHHLVRNYREAYNIHASSGILFNHESVLRKDGFFIKKLIHDSLDIKNGKRDSLVLGNIDIKRDFGYAPEYVKAMILMATSSTPDDYLICSGKSVSLRSIVFHVLDHLNIDHNVLKTDSELFRPSEIQDIYGDNSKAKEQLGWKYNLSFYDVLSEMIEEYSNNIYG